MSLRKQLPCGKDLSYKLVPGPGGFAQALVGTEFEQTEVANLLLDVKKRPAAAAQKKPAAAQKEDCEEEPDDLPADPEEVEEQAVEEEGLPAKTYHQNVVQEFEQLRHQAKVRCQIANLLPRR